MLHSKGGLFQRCTFRFECHGRKVSVSLRLGEMKKLFAFLRNRLDPRTQGLLSRQHITVWSIGALKPALYKCMASNYREKFVLEAARENAVFPCPLSSVPFRDPRSRPQHVSSPAVVGEATPEPGSQPWPSASAAAAEAEAEAAAAAVAGAEAAAAAAAGSVPTTTSILDHMRRCASILVLFCLFGGVG